MGDRGNIVVRQAKDNKEDVWFYTHNGGSDIKQNVAEALARKQCWEDVTYLARIVFDTMTKGNQGDETGAGIGCTITDNEHDIVVVDVPQQQVFIVKETQVVNLRLPSKLKDGVSFDDFIAANQTKEKGQ